MAAREARGVLVEAVITARVLRRKTGQGQAGPGHPPQDRDTLCLTRPALGSWWPPAALLKHLGARQG